MAARNDLLTDALQLIVQGQGNKSGPGWHAADVEVHATDGPGVRGRSGRESGAPMSHTWASATCGTQKTSP